MRLGLFYFSLVTTCTINNIVHAKQESKIKVMQINLMLCKRIALQTGPVLDD